MSSQGDWIGMVNRKARKSGKRRVLVSPAKDEGGKDWPH